MAKETKDAVIESGANKELLGLEGITDADLGMLEAHSDFKEELDDYSKVDVNHFLFETQSLYDRIYPLSVIVKDRQELVSKVVWIKPEGANVFFRVNTGEIIAEVKVPLLNTTKTLEKDYVVEFTQFFSLIRNSGSKFMIKDRDGSPCVTVLGGDVELESYNLDKDLFALKVPEKTTFTKIEGGKFTKFLSKANDSMALASRPEDKRLRVEGGVAYSNFLSSVFVQRDVEIKNISFRAIDLSFLSRVLAGAAEIQFAELEKEYVFKSTWMTCAVPKIDTQDLGVIKKMVENLKKNDQFTFSPGHLYKVLNLVRCMVGNSGVIKFKADNKQLFMSANTKSGKPLQFPVATAPEGLDFQISCSIASMISTTMIMKKEAVITASVDDQKRMILDSEGVEIIFGTAA